MSKTRHIEVLTPLPGIAECCIADMHGDIEDFTKILNSIDLTKTRLVVAGDMVDRGNGSAKIIRRIIENNNNKRNQKIHALLGNHEILSMQAIDSLEQLLKLKHACENNDHQQLLLSVLYLRASHDMVRHAELHLIFNHPIISSFLENAINKSAGKSKSIQSLMSELNVYDKSNELLENLSSTLNRILNNLEDHRLNGGEWLTTLFIREWNEHYITFDEKSQTTTYAADSDVALIKHFFESLPFMIIVKDTYIAAHADIPFSDEELVHPEFMIIKNPDALIWPRENEFESVKKRSPLSLPGVTGHNIGLGVRFKQNIACIDTGTFVTKDILMLDMTNLTAIVITSPEKMEMSLEDIGLGKSLDKIVAEVNHWLSHNRDLRDRKKESSANRPPFFTEQKSASNQSRATSASALQKPKLASQDKPRTDRADKLDADEYEQIVTQVLESLLQAGDIDHVKASLFDFAKLEEELNKIKIDITKRPNTVLLRELLCKHVAVKFNASGLLVPDKIDESVFANLTKNIKSGTSANIMRDALKATCQCRQLEDHLRQSVARIFENVTRTNHDDKINSEAALACCVNYLAEILNSINSSKLANKNIIKERISNALILVANEFYDKYYGIDFDPNSDIENITKDIADILTKHTDFIISLLEIASEHPLFAENIERRERALFSREKNTKSEVTSSNSATSFKSNFKREIKKLEDLKQYLIDARHADTSQKNVK